jgi:hypothetical protein
MISMVCVLQPWGLVLSLVAGVVLMSVESVVFLHHVETDGFGGLYAKGRYLQPSIITFV